MVAMERGAADKGGAHKAKQDHPGTCGLPLPPLPLFASSSGDKAIAMCMYTWSRRFRIHWQKAEKAKELVTSV